MDPLGSVGNETNTSPHSRLAWVMARAAPRADADSSTLRQAGHYTTDTAASGRASAQTPAQGLRWEAPLSCSSGSRSWAARPGGPSRPRRLLPQDPLVPRRNRLELGLRFLFGLRFHGFVQLQNASPARHGLFPP